jgi:hypothetical protein
VVVVVLGSPAPAIFSFFSGDKAVQTAQGTYMVYVHAGTNPFDTITQAVKCVFLLLISITLLVMCVYGNCYYLKPSTNLFTRISQELLQYKPIVLQYTNI